MSNTEAPYVVSHNFCAVRANTADELYARLNEINEHPDLEDQIALFRSKVSGATAAAAVATAQQSLGATVTSNNNPSAGPEIETDRYGSKFTYNHPDAPALPDGRGSYVLKEWTSKQGKDLKAWVDPIKGPRPARSGGDEAPIIWK